MTAVTSIIGALALASTLVGCSAGGDDEGVPVARDARFFVEQEPVANLDAVLRAIELDLVFPLGLEGYELLAGQAHLPPPFVDAAARAFNTSVLLQFVRRDGSGGFSVEERGAPATPGQIADAHEIVDLDGTAVQLTELPLGGRRAVSATMLLWTSCGLEFNLFAPSSDAMPRGEVLALARAFIEGCE